MKKEFEEKIAKCFDAPPPMRREEFLLKLRMQREPMYRFVFTQISYTGKKGMIAALMILIFVVGFGRWKMHFSGDAMLWLTAAVLPLFAVAVAAEGGRSAHYKMSELECCCLYHLPEILLVRTGFLCGVNLLVLFFSYLLLRGCVSFGALTLGIYLFLPYLVTCVLILAIQSCGRGREGSWYYTVTGIFVGLLSCCLPETAKELYSGRYFMVWLSAFVLLCYIFIRQLLKIKKDLEEGRWSLYLID